MKTTGRGSKGRRRRGGAGRALPEGDVMEQARGNQGAGEPGGRDGGEPGGGGPPSTRPVRVVHVVLSMDLGGLERVVIDLVREGRALGQHVEVVCVEHAGTLAPEVESLEAPLSALGKPPGFQPAAIRRMRSLIQKVRPDVIHTHQMGALFYVALSLGRGADPLVVHTEHGRHYPGRLRARVLARLAGAFASRFYCVSTDIATSVISHRIVAPEKVRVVYNGVETVRFFRQDDRNELRRRLRLPAGVPMIGTIGRLDGIKRQDRLIRAFAALKQRVPSAHLLVVGDGPLMGELRAHVERLGLAESTSLVGYQAEPECYLRAMDLFALTSQSEGMPLVILEAWASGVPVVASRVGGVPEMIEQGVTGLLFEPGDDGGLVSALERLLTDPAEAARLAEAGRAIVRARYDVRVVALTYHDDYRALLGRGFDG